MSEAESETKPTKQEPIRKSGRQLFILRHAPCVDKVFEGWIERAFGEDGRYQPYNLNQPVTLPTRANGNFDEDCPITVMGSVNAQLMGRGMRLTKRYFSAVYTSPALRCVQTGHGLLKTLDMDLKMCVEPGLFDLLSFHNDLPRWLSLEEMNEAGYEVDLDYRPVMSAEELEKRMEESAQEGYERIEQVTRRILTKHQYPGPLLIIGHASAIYGIRTLLGESIDTSFRPTPETLGSYIPFCSMVGIEEKMDGQWKVVDSPIPQITSLGTTAKVDMQFFNRN